MNKPLTALLLLLAAGHAAAPKPASDAFATRAETLPAKESLRLVVAGDAGASDALREGLAAVHRQAAVDAILMPGDNFYECGVTSLRDPRWRAYERNFSFLGAPIYVVLGNHDYGNPKLEGGHLKVQCAESVPSAQVEATGVVSQWRMPARNYVVHGEFADFIMFDSEPVATGFARAFRGSATSDDEVAWLRQQLHRSTAQWKVVVAHHTIYSSGSHGMAHDDIEARMRRLEPVLRSEGADLYVCGHDHHLELIGDRRLRNDAPFYLVSGASYRPRLPSSERGRSEPETVFSAGGAGFALLTIRREQLSIDFYDAKGTRIGGPFVVPASEGRLSSRPK